jgi:transposase InsO family protein
MRYRESILKYASKYGVARTARKFNEAPSTIYFWRKRYLESNSDPRSLLGLSKRPKTSPIAHTDLELQQIRNLLRRNPTIGLNDLWHKLRSKGYTRTLQGLHKAVGRMGLTTKPTSLMSPTYKPKPYEQMTYPGERIQIDVKYVPRNCLPPTNSDVNNDINNSNVNNGNVSNDSMKSCCVMKLYHTTKPYHTVKSYHTMKLYQYTAIDEYSRLRFLYGFNENSSYTAAEFLEKAVDWYKKRGVLIACVQTDNGLEFTKRFHTEKEGNKSLFETTANRHNITVRHIKPHTPRHNGKVERSHREDQKLFYSRKRFFNLDDFRTQLARHMTYTNKRPMRPLNYLSPNEYLAQYILQNTCLNE